MTTSVDTAEVPDMTATAEPVEVPSLKVADRCDVGGCGAQAWVITAHLSGFLFWCAHHFHGVERTLGEQKVLDNRCMINRAPSPSS